MGTVFSYFATCPKGVEDLLAQELAALGAQAIRLAVAGVHFQGGLALGYEVCLWSRVANRLLLVLAESGALRWAADDSPLYEFVHAFCWEQHLRANGSFAVDFSGTNRIIKNTQYGAMRVKDAVVDRFSARVGTRPNVDKSAPEVRLNVRLHKDSLTLALDLSGESLHKRGYRTAQGAAPLKENLAAALLLRAGWPEIAAAGGALVDPMCGSGTLLIEAAWMALGKAPGLHRSFGFDDWLGHETALWQQIKQSAMQRSQTATTTIAPILGFDQDARVLSAAAHNVRSAECGALVQLRHCAVDQLEPPAVATPGLMICNPPYGERMGEVAALEATYLQLAQTAKRAFGHWRLAVFTGNAELAQTMRLRAKKRNKLFNGAIESQLFVYELTEGKLRTEPQVESELSEGARMVANRLRKNLRNLRPWCERNAITAFRAYDADMPEYAAAIDVYAEHLHVQEYAAPKTVDAQAAQKRLRELLQATALVFGVPRESISVKTRKRNKGAEQYERRAQKQQHTFPVREGRASLLVNLDDYLDTGLFLDHRPLRLRIADEASGKSFLNLFCYTATATVHAALGGAKESVSVDMSATYLAWAERNFKENRIASKQHELVLEDCLVWLQQCRRGFDVIMLDPPSFSNSKKMTGVLDVQRDHVSLVQRCMELLNPNGVLYFSNNLQSFKLDYDALDLFAVADISRATLDEDFVRNPKIHCCFRITHKL